MVSYIVRRNLYEVSYASSIPGDDLGCSLLLLLLSLRLIQVTVIAIAMHIVHFLVILSLAIIIFIVGLLLCVIIYSGLTVDVRYVYACVYVYIVDVCTYIYICAFVLVHLYTHIPQHKTGGIRMWDYRRPLSWAFKS